MGTKKIKVAFIGSCTARLLNFYLNILNRVEESKFGFAFENNPFTLMTLKESESGFEENFGNKYQFNIDEIFLYDTDLTSTYIPECDFIFWSRFGYRPNLSNWQGEDCDNISNPNLWSLTPEKIKSLSKPSAKIYEIGRSFYSPIDVSALEETISFENEYSPDIRCSEIIKDNIEVMKLEHPTRYSTHFSPFIYLKILNKICTIIGIDEMTSDEFDELKNINYWPKYKKGI